MNEALLAAWVQMSVLINNSKLVSTFSYNEMLIYHLLTARSKVPDAPPYTLKELASELNMYKSQVHRILLSLEDRELITKTVSADDKRIVYVMLTKQGDLFMHQEHLRILSLIDQLIAKVGEPAAKEITSSLNLLTKEAKSILFKGEKSYES